MRKQFLCLMIVFSFVLPQISVFAHYEDALDVFEEYAVLEIGEELICKNFSIELNKNGQVTEKLKFTSNISEISFFITSQPTKGAVEITSSEGEFVYTPFNNQVGDDSFSFRISDGVAESNIATCSIKINDSAEPPSPTPEPIGFVYVDMIDHWANYSAVKMVERDILKGERIGSKYYFRPQTVLKRIDVIMYILASLDSENVEIDTDNTHIFADSHLLPDYINNSAYIAHKLGIIDGTKIGDEIFLKPHENITRIELIKMIDKAMSSKTMSDIKLEFTDKHTIPDWGVQYVKNMVGYGIVKGYDDNTIRPFQSITKAEAIEMLYQMIKYNEESNVQALALRIKNEVYGNINIASTAIIRKV